MKIKISKKRRNSIFHHLGLPIPYELGKKINKFVIYLGKDIGDKTFETGEVIGQKSYQFGKSFNSFWSTIEVKVIDKSEDMLPKNDTKKTFREAKSK